MENQNRKSIKLSIIFIKWYIIQITRTFKFKIIAITILILIIVPLLVNAGTYLLPIKSLGNGSDWIGFWGSYLGGTFTLVAMIYTVDKQNKSMKQSTIDELIKKDLDLHYGIFRGFVGDMSHKLSNSNAFVNWDLTNHERTTAVNNNRKEVYDLLTQLKNKYQSLRFKEIFEFVTTMLNIAFSDIDGIQRSGLDRDSQIKEVEKLWKPIQERYGTIDFYSEQIENIKYELQN